MALCRVYTKPDNTVAILHPNPRLQNPGESDQDFLNRICAQDAPKNKLDGLPYVDLDRATLLPRAQRALWESRDGQVIPKGRPV